MTKKVFEDLETGEELSKEKLRKRVKENLKKGRKTSLKVKE